MHTSITHVFDLSTQQLYIYYKMLYYNMLYVKPNQPPNDTIDLSITFT